jgi:hypothetical protein
MTHQTLFWIPVALRFALVSVAGLATGYLWGALVGFVYRAGSARANVAAATVLHVPLVGLAGRP